MKKNNKGFSLVELIIVIAIMAILAGAIAPALIKYIDKSRKSNDVSSAKTIKTAIETALGNESIYEYLTTGDAATAGKFCYIDIKPGQKLTSSTTGAQSAITIRGAATGDINGKSNQKLSELAKDTIGSNIGEKSPKLKYQKAADKTIGTPTGFTAVISNAGTVYVFISTGSGSGSMTATDNSQVGVKSANGYQICPNICDEYQ